MSGYLQRLVSGARISGGGVHPLPGSRYAEPRSESVPAVVEEEIGVKNPVARAKAPSKESGASIAERPASNPIAPIEPSRGQPVEPEFKPLVDSAAMPVQPHIFEERFHEAQAPAAAHTTVETVRIPPVVRLAPPVEVQPSLASAAREGVRPPAPFHPAIPPRSAPARERRSSPTRPGIETPDEIQIHIGRIEVTAVPPPPPRPAAPPLRKSLDLGEYLKRGRGRSV